MSWVPRVIIIGIVGVLLLAIGVVALLFGAMAHGGPAEVFVPWGMAYLVGGGLLILAARKF